MKKRKKFLLGILATAILGGLLVMSGCGTDENDSNTKTVSNNGVVNSIKETKLENYNVNVKSAYIHQTSTSGLGLNFEVKFDNITPAYEAYVCNEMSSLYDTKIAEENEQKIKENPEAYEKMLNGDLDAFDFATVFYTDLKYDAGESVDITWVPAPTEDNASKFSSEEEYLQTGYMYLVLKEEENIIGFIVFEFPVGTSGENNLVSFEEANVLDAVAFEKVDGKYQDVSLSYVKSKIENILENK